MNVSRITSPGMNGLLHANGAVNSTIMRILAKFQEPRLEDGYFRVPAGDRARRARRANPEVLS